MPSTIRCAKHPYPKTNSDTCCTTPSSARIAQGFHVPPSTRLVLHDLPVTRTATVEEKTPGALSAAVLVAQLLAECSNGHLSSLDVRQRAHAAGVPERSLRTALRRAGLEPSYTGRGRTRRVLWHIDTRPEEIS